MSNPVHAALCRAERDLIGAVVLYGEIPRDARSLTAAQFVGDERNRLIWGRLLQMVADGEPLGHGAVIDAVTTLEVSGGTWPRVRSDDPEAPDPPDAMGYITDLLDGHIPTDGDVRHAVRAVTTAHNRRAQRLETDVLAQALARGDDDRAAQAVQRLAELRQQGTVRAGRSLDTDWRTVSALGADWLTAAPPERDYLLTTGFDDGERGVLPLGKVGLLAAAGGVGKTYSLAQLALAVASGAPWLGCYRVGFVGRVLFCVGEEEIAEVRRRLYFTARALGLSDRQLAAAAENIVPLGLAGRGVALTDDEGTPTALYREMKDRLEAERDGWRLLIFDPLSRFGGPEVEKDNSQATRLVELLEQLTQVPGSPTAIVAHHTTKNDRQGGGRGGSTVSTVGARGASGLTDGVRWVGRLDEREADGYHGPPLVRFEVTKTNYGPRPHGAWLCRRTGDEGALTPAPRNDVDAFHEAARGRTRKSKPKASTDGEAVATVSDLFGGGRERDELD